MEIGKALRKECREYPEIKLYLGELVANARYSPGSDRKRFPMVGDLYDRIEVSNPEYHLFLLNVLPTLTLFRNDKLADLDA